MKAFYADIRSEFTVFLDFIKRNKLLCAVVIFFSLLAYGLPLTQYTLSIDEENAMFRGNENYSVWSSQGRFGLSFLKLLFHYPAGNSITSTFLGVSLLAVSSILWAYMFRTQPVHSRMNTFRSIIIAVLFLTFPAYAENIGFAMMSFELGIGWVLTTLTVLFLAQGVVYKKHLYYDVLAVLCIAFVTSIYQAFLPVIICGIAMIVLLQLEDRFRNKENVSLAQYVKMGCALVILLVIGLVLYKLIDIIVGLFVPASQYIDSFFAWGTESPKVILLTLLDFYHRLFTGEIMYGSYILLPSLVVAFILIIVYVFRWIRFKAWRGTISSTILFFIVLLLSPFLMSFILGTSVLVRANFTWALFVACIWAIIYSLLHSRILKMIIMLGVLLIAFYQSNAIATLFYSDYNRYQDDVRLANQIDEQIQQLGVGEKPTVPVVFVGSHTQETRENLIQGEVLGHSFFEWDNGNPDRIMHFMNSLGYNYLMPDATQREQGLSLANTMPPWPYQGSVDLKDGLIIVNFTNHTKELAQQSASNPALFNLELANQRDDGAKIDKVLATMDLLKANTGYYSDLQVKEEANALQLTSGQPDPNISLSFMEPVDNYSFDYIKLNIESNMDGEMRMYLLQTGDTYTEKYSGGIILKKGSNIVYCKRQNLLDDLAALRIDPPNNSMIKVSSIELVK